jgi:hypothetical protein
MTGMYRRLLGRTLGLLGGGLAAFHGWIFVGQAAAGRLEDPWLIFRWLASTALIVALVALRRGGEPVLGRKSIAIWVLAALLHGPAAGAANEISSIALPESVVTSVLQLVSSAAFAASVWLLARLLRSRARSVGFYSFLAAFSWAGRTTPGVAPPFAPRPPPLRS